MPNSCISLRAWEQPACRSRRRQPRVALLNVGAEGGKGNRVVKAAAALLEADPSLRYIGFVEGDQVLLGAADVVVSDGFVGNVALKSIEVWPGCCSRGCVAVLLLFGAGGCCGRCSIRR